MLNHSTKADPNGQADATQNPAAVVSKDAAARLAAWIEDHLVNRADCHGGYWKDKEGGVNPTTSHERLTRFKITRHVTATGCSDVVGLHAIGRDDTGACVSRWIAIDIDAHGEDADPLKNAKFAHAVETEARNLGFLPILLDSNGKGGFHLWIVFDRPIPSEHAYSFASWLVRNQGEHGLSGVETFPKQATLEPTGERSYGNWIRCVLGRHHRRAHWVKAWAGYAWLEGEEAAQSVLGTPLGSPDMIPAEALTFEVKPRATATPKDPRTAAALRDDVRLAEDALGHLNHLADEYHDWFKVGCALHSLGHGGLWLWDSWSQQSPKYEPGKCEEKWATMGDDGIKLGSLIRWAEDRGWVNPQSRRALALKASPPVESKPEEPGEQDGHEGGERIAVNRTDVGNGLRFTRQHGARVRHVGTWKKWLVYDGRRWQLDDRGEVRQLAKKTARSILVEASQAADDRESRELSRWAFQSESMERLGGMLSAASTENPVAIRHDVLNADHWLLNCADGTIDLRTGELRPHDPADLITTVVKAPYDPTAKCPIWESTLKTIFADNVELIGFVQRLFGLCLTGDTSEHIFPIFWGDGSNGKSTILNVMLELLGDDLAMKAPEGMLHARGNDAHQHPTRLALFHGKRLMVSFETEENIRLNESLIKELTGGDPITARRMKEDFWTYLTTHKLILATNPKPEIRGTDFGIWRRVLFIPFEVTIAVQDQDKQLPEKLRGEFPGILAWAVRGCLDWREHGLNPPLIVQQATEDYRHEQDELGEFIASECTENEQLSAKLTALHKRFLAFTGATEGTMSQKRLSSALVKRRYKKYTNNGTWFRGIGLRCDDPTFVD